MYGCTRCPAGQDICRRCHARLCLDHGTLPGEACNECELAYHESRDGLRLNLWFLVGFALPWVVFAGILDKLPSWSARSGGVRAITTGIPMLDCIIMFTVVAVFAGKGAMALRSAFHRNEFMKPAAAARR